MSKVQFYEYIGVIFENYELCDDDADYIKIMSY